jgi:hypothetical protein
MKKVLISKRTQKRYYIELDSDIARDLVKVCQISEDFEVKDFVPDTDLRELGRIWSEEVQT